MSNDEVELGGGKTGDDYEVVPVGPIRKLERRIDEMESQKTEGSARDDELVRDVLDIMKSNQKIVNDMTESTHQLKNSVEDLTHKMNEVVDNMNHFMDLLSEASEADMEGEIINDVHSRVADAVGSEMQEVSKDIKESNSEVINHLEELNKSIKRSYTSQNKGSVGNRSNNNNQRRSSGGADLNINRGNNSQDQSRGRGRGNQNNQMQNSGGQRSQGRNQGGRNNSGGGDNIRKLRKKFDKMEDE